MLADILLEHQNVLQYLFRSGRHFSERVVAREANRRDVVVAVLHEALVAELLSERQQLSEQGTEIYLLRELYDKTGSSVLLFSERQTFVALVQVVLCGNVECHGVVLAEHLEQLEDHFPLCGGELQQHRLSAVDYF